MQKLSFQKAPFPVIQNVALSVDERPKHIEKTYQNPSVHVYVALGCWVRTTPVKGYCDLHTSLLCNIYYWAKSTPEIITQAIMESWLSYVAG